MNSLEVTQDKTLWIKFFPNARILKMYRRIERREVNWGLQNVQMGKRFFFGPLFRKSGDQSFILITDAVFTYFSLNFR